MSEKVRFGFLLSQREALVLQRLAQHDGESRAAILRRLLRAEAERRGIRPADPVRRREGVSDVAV